MEYSMALDNLRDVLLPPRSYNRAKPRGIPSLEAIREAVVNVVIISSICTVILMSAH